jgi:hypothetical protein
MLWVNHIPAMKAVGGSTIKYYKEVSIELKRFLRKLNQDYKTDN